MKPVSEKMRNDIERAYGKKIEGEIKFSKKAYEGAKK